MEQALLIVIGAVIAGCVSYGTEWLRDRRQERTDGRRERRAVVDTYLPDVLDLLVALRWLADDIDRNMGQAHHDNPYPKPPQEGTVPGAWYKHVVRLGHHPLLGDEVHAAARSIAARIEEWNAIVDDYDIASRVASDLIGDTESLISALERAVIEGQRRRSAAADVLPPVTPAPRPRRDNA